MRLLLTCLLITCCLTTGAQERLAPSARTIALSPYDYESKSSEPEFDKFNPRKAPKTGEMLLRRGDRLAIIGDSITEQKMYSRIIETYLTVCWPQLDITTRQYGWSGEKTDGFLNRMDQDCLPFSPTVATLSYGMNDARYRPFDVTNGRWYRDHYTAIVRKLRESGARVVVGSPGCAGKLAKWVTTRNGTLDEHNLHLCALRDIAIDVAIEENMRFADVFWPMMQAQVLAPKKYGKEEEPYQVAGNDGIHPGWAGHVIMAYAYLNAMGIDGTIGEFEIDLTKKSADASEGHKIESFQDGVATITSSRYPYCAVGAIDEDNSIRSGMTLVPFNQQLNRFTLKVTGLASEKAEVTWGDQTKTFDAKQLALGIQLPTEFPSNPFSSQFQKIDEAVAAKQTYETYQIKKVFHSKQGKADLPAAVEKTEAERAPLALAIKAAMKPLRHSIHVVEK